MDNNKLPVVIMAGGLGKRAASIDPSIPKPLIPIAGKPILQWEVECLVNQGYTDIILTVSHMADKIQDYFEDGTKFGCHIDYYVETTPLGNAGALFELWRAVKLDGDFLLLNADSMFDVDFDRFVEFHRKGADQGIVASLFVHPNSHPYDSGLIVTDENGIVTDWLTKEDERPKYYKNCVNAGLHIINTAVFETAGIDVKKVGTEVDGKVVKVDLDRQILKPLAGTGKMAAYISPEYVKDMGTPERFEQVSQDLKSGLVRSRNLSRPQKAIFLDRDGTINKYVGFLRDIDQFELLPGVAEAIKRINESGYLAIVVTNQPVIARGEVTQEELQLIHNKMETELGKAGAYLDAIYYCPHHPDKGFEGEIPELKTDCDCRKPKPGMLKKAAEDFNIDLASSWMIGDGVNDVKAGKTAGCRTVRIANNEDVNFEDASEAPADVCVDNLLEAVNFIRVTDKIDFETIDPGAVYVLFNKKCGRALSLIEKTNSATGNSRQIEGHFCDVLSHLITLADIDDYEIITQKRYYQILQAQMEAHREYEEEIKRNTRTIPIEEIEYKDFLFIDIIPGITKRRIEFITYLEWLMQDDFDQLKRRLADGLKVNQIKDRRGEQIIQEIVATSDSDFEKKSKQDSYYYSSASAIIQVMRHIFNRNVFETLKAADQNQKTRFIVRNYQNLFMEIMYNIEDLCSLYDQNFGSGKYYSSIRSRYIPTMAVHQVLRQELYGRNSMHSFTDLEVSASIGTIRQLIELRMRRAFGVLAYKDSNGGFSPLNMRSLFEAIKRHESDIELPLKLENIDRIYTWANGYIHSGHGDYPWIPILIERVLLKFSFGETKQDGSWSINNGIKTKQYVIDAIQQELLDEKNMDGYGNPVGSYSLVTCEVECEIMG